MRSNRFPPQFRRPTLRSRTAANRPRAAAQSSGAMMSRGNLYWILSNPIYVGRLRHKGQIHDGLHSAIIDPETFDRVQQSSRAKLRQGGYPGRMTTPSSRASSMMIAETGWARAMRPRAGGAGDTKATPKNSRFGICDFTGIGCLADSRV